MIEKEEYWYNNGWVIGLGTAFFAFVLPTIWDAIKQLPFLTTYNLIAKYIYNFFNYNFKLWWLLLLLLPVLLFKYAYPPIKAHFDRHKKENLPYTTLKSEIRINKAGNKTHFNYTGDKFEGYYWKWIWDLNPITNKISPQQITPTCNMLKCNLSDLNDVSIDKSENRYKCSNCGKIYYRLPSKSYIEERILEKVINHTF